MSRHDYNLSIPFWSYLRLKVTRLTQANNASHVWVIIVSLLEKKMLLLHCHKKYPAGSATNSILKWLNLDFEKLFFLSNYFHGHVLSFFLDVSYGTRNHHLFAAQLCVQHFLKWWPWYFTTTRYVSLLIRRRSSAGISGSNSVGMGRGRSGLGSVPGLHAAGERACSLRCFFVTQGASGLWRSVFWRVV